MQHPSNWTGITPDLVRCQAVVRHMKTDLVHYNRALAKTKHFGKLKLVRRADTTMNRQRTYFYLNDNNGKEV